MAPKPKLLLAAEEVTKHLPGLMVRYMLKIRSEEDGIIPIQPNKVQLAYHKDRMKRGFASWDIILKSRKHGFTTWKLLENLILCMEIEGFGAGLVAQETSTSARMFNILRYAYDNLPNDIKARHKTKEDRRGDGIEFENGSYIYVYTAGSRSGAGRGATLHSVHFTEVSSYFEPKDIVDGITESAPRFAHISMESTARGRGNYFHDIWEGAVAGTNPYVPHFYAWWWGDENWLPLEPGEKIEPYSDEEIDIIGSALRDGFKLKPEHIKWRRAKIQTLGDNFYQEQAEDPDTCFLMSGNPVFDAHLLRRMIQRCESALVMELTKIGDGERIVWKRPSGQYPYIISVDVAEGLSHGDWSVLSVWQDTQEALINVARTKVHVSLDDLAAMIAEESRLYHNALVAVERNGLGAAVVQKLDSLGITNQYHTLDQDGEELDRNGWYTNQRTKKLMIEEFSAASTAGDIVSFDRDLWTQCENIIRDENGRPMTPKRKHDDVAMAAFIAYQARDQAHYHGAGSSVVSLLG